MEAQHDDHGSQQLFVAAKLLIGITVMEAYKEGETTPYIRVIL